MPATRLGVQCRFSGGDVGLKVGTKKSRSEGKGGGVEKHRTKKVFRFYIFLSPSIVSNIETRSS
jgi:hypothetical protein